MKKQAFLLQIEIERPFVLNLMIPSLSLSLSLSQTHTQEREREEKGGGEEEKKGKEQNGTMGGT